MSRRHADRGFTLLEVLVAVAIFAIAAQLVFGGMRQVLHAREQLEPRAAQAAALRYAVTLLARDLSEATPRAVRDALGDPAPALQAGGRDELILLSRRDPARPVLLDAVAVVRIGYRLDEGRLLRDTWPVIDAVQASRPREQVLLEGVRELRLRFLSTGAADWSEVWPLATEDLATLPRAVEFELVLDDGRRLRRLLLPGQGA